LEKGLSRPDEVLNELHRGIKAALKQDAAQAESRDGMDIALCRIYPDTNKLEFAGAMRPLWIVRNNELIEVKANKQAIGGLETEGRKPFSNHVIELQKGDCVYIFSDGYA